MNLDLQLALNDIFIMEAWVGIAYYFRKVVDETVPGAGIGYSTTNEFGPREGIAIGLLF